MSPYIRPDDVISNNTEDWDLIAVSVKPSDLPVINFKMVSSFGIKKIIIIKKIS